MAAITRLLLIRSPSTGTEGDEIIVLLSCFQSDVSWKSGNYALLGRSSAAVGENGRQPMEGNGGMEFGTCKESIPVRQTRI